MKTKTQVASAAKPAPLYTLTKVRTFMGREGHGLNATITKDGKPVAFVLDDANGGMLNFDFYNPGQSPKSIVGHEVAKVEEAAFRAFAAEWFEKSGERAKWDARMKEISSDTPGHDPKDVHIAMENWVNTVADEIANKKRFDRLSKTKTLFRLEGDSAQEWRTLSAPYSPEVRAVLDKKYPGKLAAIYGVEAL